MRRAACLQPPQYGRRNPVPARAAHQGVPARAGGGEAAQLRQFFRAHFFRAPRLAQRETEQAKFRAEVHRVPTVRNEIAAPGSVYQSA